jgi:hypothetical protein
MRARLCELHILGQKPADSTILGRGLYSQRSDGSEHLPNEMEADLLVMGCYGHTRLRELLFGGASRHVLAHMSLPVLMSH